LHWRLNQSYGIASSTVINCTASSNGVIGIIAAFSATVNSALFSIEGNGITFLYGTVTNCISLGNKNVGIEVDNGSVTNSTASLNGDDGINAPGGVVAFCKASGNNGNNNGSTDIDAGGATRTGNNPMP
jgi:hypothetical protein